MQSQSWFEYKNEIIEIEDVEDKDDKINGF